MFDKLIAFMGAMFSLLFAALVRYIPILGIDFTKAPEFLQVYASWLFVMVACLLIVYMGWSFYAKS